MITAVDTSALLDVILDDVKYRGASLEALRNARNLTSSSLAAPSAYRSLRRATNHASQVA
jgi:hypothetical protein